MQTRVYRNGVLEAEGFDPSLCSDYLAEPDTVVWLDACRPTEHDFTLIADELGLHPLAREDATGRAQRPKVEPYEGHYFLVAYATSYANGELVKTEIDAFVSDRWLLTMRKNPDFDIAPLLEQWDSAAALAKYGTAFLVHGLLDVVIESHFTVIDTLDDEIDALEDALFDDGKRGVDIQRRTFDLRKALVTLRRVVLPMREVLNAVLRREVFVVAPEMGPYYQDLYDHALRAAEWTDSLRDLITTVLETYLTIQGNRLNEVMKRLTSYAAVVAVPTAIAGIYGMNTRLYPATGSTEGWWLAIGMMVALSAFLFFYFRRKDWL